MAGLNRGSIFGAGLSSFKFSDYTAIKNGSYRKFLRSHYSGQRTRTSTKTADRIKYNDNRTSDRDFVLTKLKDEADELKKAAKALNSSELWKPKDDVYNVDKIADAVKNFVKEYNDTVEQSAKTNTKNIRQYADFMKSMTKTMSRQLSKAGITAESDGKLSVDEEALKKADIKDLKALFSGYSYASQIESKAGLVANAAAKSAIINAGGRLYQGSDIYSNTGLLSGNFYNSYNNWC